MGKKAKLSSQSDLRSLPMLSCNFRKKKTELRKLAKKNAQPEWYRSAKLAPSPLILFFIDRAVPLWSPL